MRYMRHWRILFLATEKGTKSVSHVKVMGLYQLITRNVWSAWRGRLKGYKMTQMFWKSLWCCHREQAMLGIVERALRLETPEKSDYLPHHAVVWKDTKITKLRMVYDASSKKGKRGLLINNQFHVGPTLLPLLYEILIQFRQKHIALVDDIEMAFLNIKAKLADHGCLGLRWVENVDREIQ